MKQTFLTSIAASCVVLLGFSQAYAADSSSAVLHPSTPVSPSDSLKHFHVKDGYEIELVASEPLVHDPVAIAFGPDGKLWVVEMADYPYGQYGKMKPMGRIRYLEDTDGDGKYDKSTLFMEGVNFPNGIMPWRKGVIVTAAPEIFYAEDTDGDGKADVRRTLYSGFTEGNPQLRVNGPTWGLDNWVYIANGMSSRGKVVSKGTVREISPQAVRTSSPRAGKPAPPCEIDVTGHDLRIRPDDGSIETEAGNTEFGRNRDDWGDYFGCDNSHPMWHFVMGESYLRRNPYVLAAKPTDAMGLMPNGPVYPLSAEQKRYHSFEHARHYTSACSAMVYRDELLFPRRANQRDAFVCEPVHNLVQHYVLTESGTTFKAARGESEKEPDFIASDDQWCRPVFVTTGPDGALWFADMYRYMIEHPDWLPKEGQDEYRPFFRLGEDRGRIYRVYPKGQRPRPIPRMDKLSPAELVAALNSPNGWQRDMAHQLLVWKDDASVAPLLAAMLESNRNPLARLHALCVLDGISALKPGSIEKALSDENPAVRRQALRLAEPRAGGAPHLVDAAVKLASDPDAKVRLQLACSLGEWDGLAAGEALGRLALSDGNDPFINTAIMSAAPRHFDALTQAMLRSKEIDPPLLHSLLDMSIATGKRPATASLLNAVLAPHAGKYSVGQIEAFGQFLDSVSLHKSSISTLEREQDDDLTKVLKKGAEIFAAARQLAADFAAAPQARAAGVGLLGRQEQDAFSDQKQLAALLNPRTPTPVQKVAVTAIARIGGEDTPAMLMRDWPSHSPEVRGAIVQALLGNEAYSWRLVQAIKAGIVAPTELDAAGKQRLLRHASPRIKAEAEHLLRDSNVDRQKAIEAFRPALALQGDTARGAKVFTASCSTCHHLGGIGQEIGPNLRSVSGWSPDMLLTNILDPNRQVEPRYLSYTATLTNGESVFGIITAETGNGILIKSIDGKERELLRGSIQALAGSGRSLMPDGLEANLSPQDVADLLRFLQSPPSEP